MVKNWSNNAVTGRCQATDGPRASKSQEPADQPVFGEETP